MSPELEECLAILVRAVFVNSIDPTLPQHERWAIYANFPGLPWRPHPNDLPVELPDVH